MNTETCELCIALQNIKEVNNLICNTKLYETENFVIVPSIGPLIAGQARQFLLVEFFYASFNILA
jgi:hypothetical protein